jgi:succinate dehydrogenase/fumarate reductase flavoprotein subunit
MRSERIAVGRTVLDVCSVNTLVVGSGAAALNAAVSLHDLGQHDLAIVTEAWGGGTSANAGSDKQTYYKLSLSGPVPDSPRLLAQDLFAGGSMHGDIALCEAQHSAQAFYHLVRLGVPFPHDRYGAYPGYQTDHDQRGRATSAGPLTSHLMVKCLSRAVQSKRIPVFEPYQVVALLTDASGTEPRIAGAVALDLQACADGTPRYLLFNAPNVILGTGGPGGLYLDSVYPVEQTGSIGLAFRAGATAQNLTESQFGLSSIGVRWNVSGSYQQVIPRYVSTDAGGGDAREFLNDAFPDAGTLGTAIFRKGYQWPFDPRRVRNHGSSLIDLLVYRERVERGRRVFLDFTRDFAGGGAVGPFAMAALHPEAHAYLEKCGATGETPIARLGQMNQPAIDFYRGRGIDLAQDRLEIAVCAQHNNGGLRGNLWWESNVAGLFPVGEVNGSHGVRRPGGASLNAGQVGSLRAAMFIASRRATGPIDAPSFVDRVAGQVTETLAVAEDALADRGGARVSADEARRVIQERMSRAAGHIRVPAAVTRAVGEAHSQLRDLDATASAGSAADLPAVFRNRDLCAAHVVYLEALAEYLSRGGQSRGSWIVLDPAGEAVNEALGEGYRFTVNPADAFVDAHILEVALDPDGTVRKTWVPVRPLPDNDAWFETAWKAHRTGAVFD